MQRGAVLSALETARALRTFLAVEFGLQAAVDVRYRCDPMPNESDCKITIHVRAHNGPPDVITLGYVRDALRDRVDARAIVDVLPAWCIRHDDCRDHPEIGRACWEDWKRAWS